MPAIQRPSLRRFLECLYARPNESFGQMHRSRLKHISCFLPSNPLLKSERNRSRSRKFAYLTNALLQDRVNSLLRRSAAVNSGKNK